MKTEIRILKNDRGESRGLVGRTRQRCFVGSRWLPLAAFTGLLLAVTLTALEAKPESNGADSQDSPTNAAQVLVEDADSSSNAPEGGVTNRESRGARAKQGVDHEAMVMFGHNAVLKAGDTAEVVVVIGGSAKIYGKVREAVVVIGGDADIQGEVGQDVVAVMGSVKAGPRAKIHGQTVSVGGSLDVADGASVHGQTVEVPWGGEDFPKLNWLKQWFLHCVLLMRPLAPQVGWVWVIAAIAFFFYLLIAAVFPRPIQICIDELTRRPATTFFLGLLTKLLAPLVALLLIATGIGIVVVPFLSAALIIGGILGKVALTEWLGLSLGRHASAPAFSKPLIGFLIGTAIIYLLYMVPILGLLTFMFVSIWGLGCATTAAFSGLRREMPEKPVSLPPPAYAASMAPATPAQPWGVPPPVAGFAPVSPSGDPSEPSSGLSGSTQSSVPPSFATPPVQPNPPVLSELLTYPKAGFWERMGAAFLDLVLVGILGRILGGFPWVFLVALAYFAGMWAWKGTTVGGIVLGLKVVRMDEQPVSFAVALVRALAAAFSAVVFFLGFLWIAWDQDKQGWHDRIAGTFVLRLPRGTPLVCL